MDTGTSLIAMPNAEFASLAAMWKRDFHSVICSSELCYFKGSCSSNAHKLSPLKFKFDGEKYFTLPALEYLIQLKEEKDLPEYCIFGVQGGIDASLNLYIFGDVFLRSYYSIYDFENYKVGLALHKYSTAKIELQSRKMLYVLLGISTVVLIFGIFGFVYCSRKKR